MTMRSRKILPAVLGLLILSLLLGACNLSELPGFGFLENVGGAEETSGTEAPQAQEQTQPVVTVPPTTEAPRDLYWVWADGGLRVRTGPGRDYEIVGSLQDQDVVEPLKWENGWAYIESPLTGWCSGDYLHQLGWYKDVRMPTGSPVSDGSLIGKWMHLTQMNHWEGNAYCEAGVIQLNADGTFLHKASSFSKPVGASWATVMSDYEYRCWTGEYTFDGTTLVLRYMALLHMNFNYDANYLESRDWKTMEYTVTMTVSRAADGLTFVSSNPTAIPVYYDPLSTVKVPIGDNSTMNVLYKVSGAEQFPQDICSALNRWFP